MQFYIDSEREREANTLPDGEVFFRNVETNRTDGWLDDNGAPLGDGFYWWACFPGCLPDNAPAGPFDTEADALDDAREDFYTLDI